MNCLCLFVSLHVVYLFLTMEMLSRTNTQALKGVAAIGIFVFHILLRYNISPLFNMWGGLCVAVFLILSGFGLEESFREKGLDGFWQKRFKKVVLPFVFFVIAYNFLFPFLPLDGRFVAGEAMHKCLDELLYIRPIFWFVFFIVGCYAVYWIGTRFLKGWCRLLFFVACAFVCLNWQSPTGHLEAEQSFSFLAGVLLSMYKDKIDALSGKDIRKWTFFLLTIGAFFLCLKMIPPLHELKGTIAYNYMLCPFRLTTGLAAIPILTMFHVGKSALLRTAGKYSLEIYIAHIPFMGMIVDGRSTALFMVCSAVGFVILLIYRWFIEERLNIVETVFIIVNVLFVAKYSSRISETACLCATLFAVVFYYVLLRYRNKIQGVWSRKLTWVLCLIAFLGMLTLQFVIDPYSIQVDRWSALHFPIQNLLGGVYPYSANTHLGGSASPFPVWQVLHIPFYLIGNVGLSFFVVVAFFIWSCWKTLGKEKMLIISLLLCFSVAVWYEVAVRSDLITNMLLVAAIINLVIYNINQPWVEKQQWWIACVVGLLASTRVIVLIPIMLMLLPYFIRLNWRSQIGTILLSVFVFMLTFVPLALWDWNEFFYSDNSPWALQTSQGNLLDFILYVPLGIFLAMNHKGIAFRYYRNSALMLLAFVAVTFIHNMYVNENWSLFSTTYDITYFTVSLPFCLLALSETMMHDRKNVSIT